MSGCTGGVYTIVTIQLDAVYRCDAVQEVNTVQYTIATIQLNGVQM